MELKRNKEKKLFWMFLRQVIGLAGAIFLEISLFFVLFMIGLNTKAIVPANYIENYLKENEEQIAKSEPFKEELIPLSCNYGLFDQQGNYKKGTLSKKEIKIARNYLLKGENIGWNYLFIIKRQDGFCVVPYTLSAHFSNSVLQWMFPKLELFALILFILIFIIIVIVNAIFFGKKLKKELTPLLDEIKQIKEKDLEFSTKTSKIHEFNDILIALNEMKFALSESLKAEWRTEQRRKDNISAISHDIKTPLTIIKGNVELMKEEDDIMEIYKQADTVNQNVDKIERYIKLLIDETKGVASQNNETFVKVCNLIESVESQSRDLCEARQLPFVVDKKSSDVEILVDDDLWQRAVMNLVGNAIENTNEKEGVKIIFEYENSILTMKVEDYGNGFSKEALQHATEQFFTERIERSDEHYGLGMHFANQVAKKYNGEVLYSNKNTKGAIVTFWGKFNEKR